MTNIDYAKLRLIETDIKKHNENNKDNAITYSFWAGYLDGARAQKQEDLGKEWLPQVSELTSKFIADVTLYAKQMQELLDAAQRELYGIEETDQE